MIEYLHHFDASTIYECATLLGACTGCDFICASASLDVPNLQRG